MRYDLLIKGGRAIDLAGGFDGRTDIGIAAGKISDISPDLDAAEAKEIIDAAGLIVTPGLIDFHAHALFLSGLGMGSDLDPICRSTGVTTVVDGGSSGAATFPVFRDQFIDTAQTRIRVFLHISSIGLADLEVGESTYLNLHDPERAADTANTNPDLIVGIKVRQQAEAVGHNGLEPLRLAKRAASLAGGLPVMVHVTNPPCPLSRILELLEPGDIVSHFLHGKGHGMLDENGKIYGAVSEARQRGVLFDVGGGPPHVDFDVARIAVKEGFLPDTISTDLTRGGMAGIVKNFPHTLSKFLNLGLDIGAVMTCATTNPARLLGMEGEIGTLQKGAVADIAVFDLESGDFKFEDAEGRVLSGDTRLDPRYTVREGKIVWRRE